MVGVGICDCGFLEGFVKHTYWRDLQPGARHGGGRNTQTLPHQCHTKVWPWPGEQIYPLHAGGPNRANPSNYAAETVEGSTHGSGVTEHQYFVERENINAQVVQQIQKTQKTISQFKHVTNPKKW